MPPPFQPEGLAPCLEVALGFEPGADFLELAWGLPLRNWLRAQNVAARVRPIFPDLDPSIPEKSYRKLFRWHRIYLPHIKALLPLYHALRAPDSPAERVCLVPLAVEPPSENLRLVDSAAGLAPRDLSAQRRPSPAGVGSPQIPGADGGDIPLADIEQGWGMQGNSLRHRYLHHLRPELLGEDNDEAGARHGTRTLGVIYSRDHDIPVDEVRGLAPEAGRLLLLGNRRPVAGGGAIQTTADQIGRAITELPPGSILLIEAQTVVTTPAGTGDYVPVEYQPSVFDAIFVAKSRGIIVVEAAGNGGIDLGSVHYDGKPAFHRTPVESGAILVGAGRWDSGRGWLRHPDSNYGDRIDCFAAGEGVVTTSHAVFPNETAEEDCLWDNFNGTSAAAAVIAGVARSFQAMAVHRRGARLGPDAIRNLLCHAAFSTPSLAGQHIRRMPDLLRLESCLAGLPGHAFLSPPLPPVGGSP